MEEILQRLVDAVDQLSTRLAGVESRLDAQRPTPPPEDIKARYAATSLEVWPIPDVQPITPDDMETPAALAIFPHARPIADAQGHTVFSADSQHYLHDLRLPTDEWDDDSDVGFDHVTVDPSAVADISRDPFPELFLHACTEDTLSESSYEASYGGEGEESEEPVPRKVNNILSPVFSVPGTPPVADLGEEGVPADADLIASISCATSTKSLQGLVTASNSGLTTENNSISSPSSSESDSSFSAHSCEEELEIRFTVPVIRAESPESSVEEEYSDDGSSDYTNEYGGVPSAHTDLESRRSSQMAVYGSCIELFDTPPVIAHTPAESPRNPAIAPLVAAAASFTPPPPPATLDDPQALLASIDPLHDAPFEGRRSSLAEAVAMNDELVTPTFVAQRTGTPVATLQEAPYTAEERDFARSVMLGGPGAQDVVTLDEKLAALRNYACKRRELDMFDLRVVHSRFRTGFEDSKEISLEAGELLGMRYQVLENLGSAAFSSAARCYDHMTRRQVCVKVVKNDKDYVDQSLDEIKLLYYVNSHDPEGKNHIVELHDCFYFREHLILVFELLKSNLFEAHRHNQLTTPNQPYFTLPRVRKIAKQVLESLAFIHGLGLVHADIKPENILIDSFTHSTVKLIDLGSSCFVYDHLHSYVQSRSYRAPEVLIGAAYDSRIDIWSLGCVIVELLTGRVLFLNDTIQTILARIMAICGPIPRHVIAAGKQSHEYFTRSMRLYETVTDQFGYRSVTLLAPRRTSLRARTGVSDPLFLSFIASCLEVDPAKRMSAAELLTHPWLQGE